MDFKELISTIKNEKYLYLGIIAACIAIGAGIFALDARVYKAELLVNVARNGVQKTQEYTYDNFYRLQADERFADTIVRWIESERILQDSVGITKKEDPSIEWIRSVKARRVSSQAIVITYASSSQAGAEKFATALVGVVNKQIENLDSENRQENWFTLKSNKPTVEKGGMSLIKILLISTLSGVFIGFWVVLLKEYFQEEQKQKKK